MSQHLEKVKANVCYVCTQCAKKPAKPQSPMYILITSNRNYKSASVCVLPTASFDVIIFW